jgi:hypothetical protein
MHDNELYACIWRCITVLLIAVTVAIFLNSVLTTRQFVEGGYVECTLQGSAQTAWCKEAK